VAGRPRPSDPTHRPTGPGRAARLIAVVLLAAPLVALLSVPSYARAEPRLLGFPFFYWYQLSWVFLSALTTWSAHLLLAARRVPGHHSRSKPRRRSPYGGGPRPAPPRRSGAGRAGTASARGGGRR
jgi:Protein of unknown function (DUF3311)